MSRPNHNPMPNGKGKLLISDYEHTLYCYELKPPNTAPKK